MKLHGHQKRNWMTVDDLDWVRLRAQELLKSRECKTNKEAVDQATWELLDKHANN